MQAVSSLNKSSAARRGGQCQDWSQPQKLEGCTEVMKGGNGMEEKKPLVAWRHLWTVPKQEWGDTIVCEFRFGKCLQQSSNQMFFFVLLKDLRQRIVFKFIRRIERDIFATGALVNRNCYPTYNAFTMNHSNKSDFHGGSILGNTNLIKSILFSLQMT